MKAVVFCGKRGHGKSFCARLMAHKYGGEVWAFARPLKEEVASLFPNHTLDKENRLVREIYQRVGALHRQFNENHFILIMDREFVVRRHTGTLPKNIWVEDGRYENEIEYVRRRMGGEAHLIIKEPDSLYMPTVDSAIDAHESETALDKYSMFDGTCAVKSGDLKGLCRYCETLADRLGLKPVVGRKREV